MASPTGAAFSSPTPYIQADQLQLVKLTTIDLIGGIKCHVCQLIFGNKKEFDSHYVIHNSGNANTVYTCVVCFKEIPSYPTFRSHCYLHVIKDKFKCETCSKMFSKLSVLQNHITTVHKFFCPSCKKEFPSKKELRIHQITHKNDDSPPYTCQICTEQIEDIDNCAQHIEEHCTFTYSCPICNEDISSPSAAAEHLSVHFDTNVEHIPDPGPTDIPDDSSLDLIGGIFCCHCDNVYKNRTEFDTHYIEQHGDDIVYSCNICGKQYEKYLLFGDHCYYHITRGRFECDECDKTFPRLSLLVLHTEAFHAAAAGQRAFTCGHCAHVFGTADRLQAHVRDKHQCKPLACPDPDCTSMFESPKDLIYHQRVHKTGNRCRHCGLQFASIVACERHIHVHRKKLYSCPVCNRNYAEKYLVMKHMPQHFSSVLHLCKVCGKVFNAKHRLVEHIKCHSKVRDHICSYCGKGFVKAYHLEQHLNIHTGLKPYKCDMCPKTFASHPNFSKHVRRMHSGSNLKSILKGTNNKNEKATATPNETKQANGNETMAENNNVVQSDARVDSKSADDFSFMFEESDDSAIETDSSGPAALQQHCDLYEASVSADLPQYVGPLPDTNLTFVSDAGSPAVQSQGLPREYGPDLVNVIDLDDHILPHIDPLLTINQPGFSPINQSEFSPIIQPEFSHELCENPGYDAPWNPIIAKVYQEYPSYGDITDGRLSVDTDIY